MGRKLCFKITLRNPRPRMHVPRTSMPEPIRLNAEPIYGQTSAAENVCTAGRSFRKRLASVDKRSRVPIASAFCTVTKKHGETRGGVYASFKPRRLSAPRCLLIIPSPFDGRLNLVVSRHASAIHAPHCNLTADLFLSPRGVRLARNAACTATPEFASVYVHSSSIGQP